MTKENNSITFTVSKKTILISATIAFTAFLGFYLVSQPQAELRPKMETEEQEQMF